MLSQNDSWYVLKIASILSERGATSRSKIFLSRTSICSKVNPTLPIYKQWGFPCFYEVNHISFTEVVESQGAKNSVSLISNKSSLFIVLWEFGKYMKNFGIYLRVLVLGILQFCKFGCPYCTASA